MQMEVLMMVLRISTNSTVIIHWSSVKQATPHRLRLWTTPSYKCRTSRSQRIPTPCTMENEQARFVPLTWRSPKSRRLNNRLETRKCHNNFQPQSTWNNSGQSKTNNLTLRPNLLQWVSIRISQILEVPRRRNMTSTHVHLQLITIRQRHITSHPGPWVKAKRSLVEWRNLMEVKGHRALQTLESRTLATYTRPKRNH